MAKKPKSGKKNPFAEGGRFDSSSDAAMMKKGKKAMKGKGTNPFAMMKKGKK